MNAKRMLADVLWDAANEYLSNGDDRHDFDHYRSQYTCDAIYFASNYENDQSAMRLLRRLGLPRNAADNYDLFRKLEEGKERQTARYFWLLLAMHVAEDEAIEV